MLSQTEQAQIEQYVNAKNHWIAQQIEVEYPTPESIVGRKHYLDAQANIPYQISLADDLLQATWVDEVIEVDFHKLTVLFSQLQAQYLSEDEEVQALLIEFLTQIILDDEYHLALGFLEGEAVAAVIYKFDGDVLLTFDLAVSSKFKTQGKEKVFLADLLVFLSSKSLKKNKVIHPKTC